MNQPHVPRLDGKGLKIGIVVARFNWNITGAMLDLAQKELVRLGVAQEDILVDTVPGSFEVAMTAKEMIESENPDAVICFGCVMKGETRHDILIGDAAVQGVQRVAIDTGVPVIFGVMCAENLQQAEERIERGAECAQTAVEMASTFQAIKQHKHQNMFASVK